MSKEPPLMIEGLLLHRRTILTHANNYLFYDRVQYHMKTGPLIYRANQWTGSIQ